MTERTKLRENLRGTAQLARSRYAWPAVGTALVIGFGNWLVLNFIPMSQARYLVLSLVALVVFSFIGSWLIAVGASVMIGSPQRWTIGRALRAIAAGLVGFTVVVVPFLILLFFVTALSIYLGLHSYAFYAIAAMLALPFAWALCSLYLVLPSAVIADNSILGAVRQSHRLASGNRVALFSAFLLLQGVPTTIGWLIANAIRHPVSNLVYDMLATLGGVAVLTSSIVAFTGIVGDNVPSRKAAPVGVSP